MSKQEVLDKTQADEPKEEIQGDLVENPVTDEKEQSKSSREEIEDMLTQSKPEDLGEPDEDSSTSETESSDDADSDDSESEDSESAVQDDEENTEETDEIENMVEESVKKDGKQKRIDKLTAINSELQDELNAIKEQLGILKKNEVKQKDEERVYSDKELKLAYDKAVTDGDSDLQWEIMQEMTKNAERNAYKRIKEESTKQEREAQKAAEEVKKIQEQYSYLADDGIPEVYDNSHKELNVNDPNSLLCRTANYLYNYQSKEAATKYRNSLSGISLAVNDALKIILNSKKGLRPKDKEKEALKQKVKKAGKKTTVKSSGAVKSDTKTPKPKSESESFQEEIERRKKMAQGVQ